ncbi:hypothetical protein EMGBS3_14520 [Anaerolineaceae bacterium]|nr:hypothetical protein EMGBS3_14520 [Anaerolineaceae bacterium]
MVELNPRRQRLAKEYARTQRRLGLAETLLSAAYIGVWLATGLAVALGSYLAGLQNWLRIAALGAAIGAPLYVVTLPLAFYRGYKLPHKYEQGNQTVRDWWMDQLKALLISVLLGGFVLELLYWLLAWQPLTWWLWLGAALLLFNVLLTNLAPLVIVPIFLRCSRWVRSLVICSTACSRWPHTPKPACAAFTLSTSAAAPKVQTLHSWAWAIRAALYWGIRCCKSSPPTKSRP